MATGDVTPPDVASVSVAPPTVTVTVGSQASLRALVQDAGGKTIPGSDVFWSVDNPSIATISDAGIVTGIALGTAQVAANVNGKSGLAIIRVDNTPVSTVVVTPAHVDATTSAQTQLVATVYDAARTLLSGRAITWSSSNAAVAAVDEDGIVSTASPGTATITATSEGKSGAATITVAPGAVANVSVTPSPLSMSVGQSTQLTATLSDAAGNSLNGRVVTWSSSNPNVATISAQGMVTGLAPGTTTITATSEGKTGTAVVTTTNVAVGSVTVQPQAPSVAIGSKTQLSAIVRDVNGTVVTDRVVTWSSANLTIASVSSSGNVTGVALGSTTITAASEGKSGATTVTVTPVPVGSVTVSPATASTHIGATTTLAAAVKDQNGTVITNPVVAWTSSNAAVATVASGVVTGVALGSATITANSGGKSGTATVTVAGIPVASVTVSPSTKTLIVTDNFAFSVTVKDSLGTVVTDRPVSWSSSSASVATVSPTGAVTAVSPGLTTITATSEGKSGTAALTVAPGSVSVAPSVDSAYVGQTATLTATAFDKKGNPISAQGFVWSAAEPNVATVSQSGAVTGVGAGSTTIVVTLLGQSAQATFKVLAPVATVAVSPANPSISTKESVTLQAALKDASNKAIGPGRVVTWTSSDPSIASIAPVAGTYSATVSGNKVGTVTITATSEGKTGTATVTVKK